MKYKRLLLISSISLSLLLGSFTLVNTKEETYKQSYSLGEPDKTLYIDLSLNEKYKESEAHPYLNYFDGSNHKINLISDGNDIYHTESQIPHLAFTLVTRHIQICCYDGLYTSDYIYGNEETNLLADPLYDYICLSSSKSIEGYGRYLPRTKNPDEATYLTQRVWLSDNSDSSTLINVVSYEYENQTYLINMPHIVNTYNNETLYYVDIPYQVRSLSFLKMKPNGYLINSNTYIDYLSFGVCYSGTSIVNVDKADVAILASVVESYLTYGKDPSNGTVKSTVRNLFNTWFKNKSASEAQMKEAKILDYTGYAANGNKYDGLDKHAGGYFSVNEKWNTMCSQAGIDPKTGGDRAFTFTLSRRAIILIVGGVIAVLFVGGFVTYFVIKRKRKN